MLLRDGMAGGLGRRGVGQGRRKATNDRVSLHDPNLSTDHFWVMVPETVSASGGGFHHLYAYMLKHWWKSASVSQYFLRCWYH